MPTELLLRARHQGGLRVATETARHAVPTDYPLEPGQETTGMTSLELLLAALASCSANGLMLVLQRRMGLAVEGLEVEARGRRQRKAPVWGGMAVLHLRAPVHHGLASSLSGRFWGRADAEYVQQ